MKDSIMQDKLKKAIYSIIAIAIFFLAWHIGSLLINNSFIFPGVSDTFSALLKIVTDKSFFSAVLLTLSRVLIGLAIGIVLGAVLGFASYKNQFLAQKR